MTQELVKQQVVVSVDTSNMEHEQVDELQESIDDFVSYQLASLVAMVNQKFALHRVQAKVEDFL